MRNIMMLLEDSNLEEIGRLGRLAGAAAMGMAAALGSPGPAQAAQPTSTSQQERAITADHIEDLLDRMAGFMERLPSDGPDRGLWNPALERARQAWNGVKNDPRLAAAVLDQINGNATRAQYFRQAPGIVDRMMRGDDVGHFNRNTILAGAVTSIGDMVRNASAHARYLDTVRR